MGRKRREDTQHKAGGWCYVADCIVVKSARPSVRPSVHPSIRLVHACVHCLIFLWLSFRLSRELSPAVSVHGRRLVSLLACWSWWLCTHDGGTAANSGGGGYCHAMPCNAVPCRAMSRFLSKATGPSLSCVEDESTIQRLG